jgi:hypothetical protein
VSDPGKGESNPGRHESWPIPSIIREDLRVARSPGGIATPTEADAVVPTGHRRLLWTHAHADGNAYWSCYSDKVDADAAHARQLAEAMSHAITSQ